MHDRVHRLKYRSVHPTDPNLCSLVERTRNSGGWQPDRTGRVLCTQYIVERHLVVNNEGDLRVEWQRREQHARGLKPQARQVDVGLVVDGHALHRRHDDPLDVATRVRRIVNRCMSAVLGIILVAVLSISSAIVEVLSVRVNQLYRRTVSVDINNCP